MNGDLCVVGTLFTGSICLLTNLDVRSCVDMGHLVGFATPFHGLMCDDDVVPITSSLSY